MQSFLQTWFYPIHFLWISHFQFSLFAWTHVALLCVVTQSYLIIQNMFEGLIWFIMPIMMVIINDIMAYMFGFTMGRTPLIQLSPKKTWEGFIGGGLATVVMSLGLAYFMCQVWKRARTPSTFIQIKTKMEFFRFPTLSVQLCTAVSWTEYNLMLMILYRYIIMNWMDKKEAEK